MLEAPIKVYNFEVEDFHTYFVGDGDGVLVHNSCNHNSAWNTERRNYWKQRANTADAVIDSIVNNVSNSYIDDILMETDTWEEYYILRYGEY